MAKSSLHVRPQRSMSAEQSNENERRWTKEQYDRKNAESGNHYDWSRRELNFEVCMNRTGKPEIRPLRSSAPLNERLQIRLDELKFKAYKKDARNNPICCIDWVLGGDQDRMRELAFGNQDVAFDLSRDNSHVKREQLIEQWAVDAYEYAVKEWGAENVIGMEVHLDESTPHAHLLVVPTAIRKQRGRIKPGTERKEKLTVSFSGKVGDSQTERAEYTSRIHTEFAEQVGSKYGLERGDVIMELPEEERDARVHKNKHQLEAERRSKIREQEANRTAEEIERNNEDLKQQLISKQDELNEVSSIVEREEQRGIQLYKTNNKLEKAQEKFTENIGKELKKHAETAKTAIEDTSAKISLFGSKKDQENRQKFRGSIITSLEEVISNPTTHLTDIKGLPEEIRQEYRRMDEHAEQNRRFDNISKVDAPAIRKTNEDLRRLHPREAGLLDEMNLQQLPNNVKTKLMGGEPVTIRQKWYDPTEKKHTDEAEATLSVSDWELRFNGKTLRQFLSQVWMRMREFAKEVRESAQRRFVQDQDMTKGKGLKL